MKDFWDVAAVASQFEFDGERVRAATAATFDRRQTLLEPSAPAVLTAAFYENSERLQHWDRFQTQVQPAGVAPESFGRIGELIRQFVGPVFRAITVEAQLPMTWKPGQGWRTRSPAPPATP